MRAFVKPLLLFVTIFAAAYVARQLIVPDVVPIAEGESSSWQLQVAFLLTSIINVGAFGTGLILLLGLLRELKKLVAG